LRVPERWDVNGNDGTLFSSVIDSISSLSSRQAYNRAYA
jgi:hypothetical protein